MIVDGWLLLLIVDCCFFFGIVPQTGLPVGFYLRKKQGTGHASALAVLCWARIWLWWARGAGLGVVSRRAGRAGLGWAWGLSLVGALCCVGRGFGRGGRAGLGWASWDLAVLGALGWVGRGVWLWWARWAGLGADLD